MRLELGAGASQVRPEAATGKALRRMDVVRITVPKPTTLSVAPHHVLATPPLGVFHEQLTLGNTEIMSIQEQYTLVKHYHLSKAP